MRVGVDDEWEEGRSLPVLLDYGEGDGFGFLRGKTIEEIGNGHGYF